MNTEQFDYLKSYPKVHDAVLEVHRRMELQTAAEIEQTTGAKEFHFS